MAMAKLACVLLLALLGISMITTQVMAEEASQYHVDKCPSECSRRCSKTQYHKPCMFFCQKCCAKCLCVPSGFLGNKAVCPSYNNWKTKHGGPKCP